MKWSELKVGDIVHNKWGYDLEVKKHENGKLYGILVCDESHPCKNMKYAIVPSDLTRIVVQSKEVKTMKWKVGDWCFCEYKLQMIKEMSDDGRITSVSDGCFQMGAYDLSDKCFPLTLEGKNISDAFVRIYQRMYDQIKNGNYNFPDFHRYSVKQWVEAMNYMNSANTIIDDFDYWCREVIDKVGKIGEVYVGSIPLMRR